MRRFAMFAVTVLLIACANDQEQTDSGADTVQVAPPPSSISLADVAGTWNMRAMPEGSDSVLTTYQLWAANDTVWRMKFDNRPDTLHVRVLAVEGDSVRVQVGPYSSALRKNVSVTTLSTYRLAGDKLVGRSVAHYSVSTPDSVRYIRTEGTRP